MHQHLNRRKDIHLFGSCPLSTGFNLLEYICSFLSPVGRFSLSDACLSVRFVMAVNPILPYAHGSCLEGTLVLLYEASILG